MEEDEVFDKNYNKKIKKITDNDSGSLINIISGIYYILAIVFILIGIVYSFETGLLALIIGIAVGVTLIVLSVILKMFYEIHYVIIHLKDALK